MDTDPYYTRPMSPAPADLVNAAELAGRAATLERSLALRQMPRLVDAGALEGTQVQARIAFGTFEGRTTVDVAVEGTVTLRCQRCLQPCPSDVDEHATLVVVPDDESPVPGGYEAVVGNDERLSLVELIEEQVLLGLPLVPMHDAAAGGCDEADGAADGPGPDAATGDVQRPFANLRDLLAKRDG